MAQPNPLSLVPVHFDQLKELRNGTISYIQIIKRDQTRPPVRPVCRKLGVTKLSEIKSESDMYEALVCVAQGQLQKVKESESSNGYHFESSPETISTKSFHDSASSKLQMSSPFSIKLPKAYQQSNSASYSHSPRTEFTPPAEPAEFNRLVDCVLNIRVAWDPRDHTQRLDFFAYKYDLDEKFLLNALKRICEILGCVHLSPQVEIDLVVNAARIFFKQVQPSRKPFSLPLSQSTPGFRIESPHSSARAPLSYRESFDPSVNSFPNGSMGGGGSGLGLALSPRYPGGAASRHSFDQGHSAGSPRETFSSDHKLKSSLQLLPGRSPNHPNAGLFDAFWARTCALFKSVVNANVSRKETMILLDGKCFSPTLTRVLISIVVVYLCPIRDDCLRGGCSCEPSSRPRLRRCCYGRWTLFRDLYHVDPS